MSNKKNPLIITIIFLTALLCFTNSSMAADPAELETLRKSFTTAKQGVRNESQRKEVIYNYIEQLTDLATDLRIYKHDIAGANMVRKEIRKARKELDADPAPRTEAPKPVIEKPAPRPGPKPVVPEPSPEPLEAKPTPKPTPPPVAAKPKPEPVITKPNPKPAIAIPTPKPVVAIPAPIPVVKKQSPTKPIVAKPKPKPVAAKPKPKPNVPKKPAKKAVAVKAEAKPALVKEHTPQTHVSSVQGLAGDGGSSKNNIYTFNLEGIGSSTTLAFWATGRNSIDTYGKVWLITPDNRRIFIRIWKESYFEYPSTQIATYYKLRPITEDITKKVTTPGTYKVEFEWTEGKDPLIIYRVEITS
ncbi:MAG: hypothetical protein ABFS18_05485 [Thermodesulfobacteriota bacterium]